MILEAAEKGDVAAEIQIGYAYRDGVSVTVNHTKAFEWFGKAAATGNVEAVDNLGWLVEHGMGTTADAAKACALYRQAAEAGHDVAMRNLLRCVRGGIGPPMDEYAVLEALYTGWLHRKTPDTSNVIAGFMVGMKSLERGKPILKQLAAVDSYFTQLCLARIFHDGVGGIAKDPTVVDACFKRARANGLGNEMLDTRQIEGLTKRRPVKGEFAYLPTKHLDQGYNMCAPTSAAMALEYYLKKPVDPYAIKKNSTGATAGGTGTAWDCMMHGIHAVSGHDWQFRSWPNDDAGFDAGLPVTLAELDAGHVVLIDLGPHTVVLSGYDAKQRVVYINNPAFIWPGIHTVSYDELRRKWHSPWHVTTTNGVEARPVLFTAGGVRPTTSASTSAHQSGGQAELKGETPNPISGGGTPPYSKVRLGKAPESNLQLSSGNKTLEEGFAWAKQRALSLVVTDGYVGRDKDPLHRVDKHYDRDGADNMIPVDGGWKASKPLAAYWGTYAPPSPDFPWTPRDGSESAPGRECFCARDISHAVVAGHLLGLDRENFTMLRLFAEGANNNDRNPYWPKWSYSFFGDPFYMDADWRELAAPFDVAQRFHMLYLWSGDPQWIRDPEIFNFQTNLHTKFMEKADDNHNGIADEHIQLATYWEDNADKFIEASDSMGCQYQALIGYAKTLEARDDKANAAVYQKKAADLHARFHQDWYDWARRRYIRGFAADGTFKTNWGHEASFFVPIQLLGDQGPRTSEHLDFINYSTYVEPINIEATTYYPEAFYKHGRSELGWYWLKFDIKSRNAYPEVAFLIVSNTVTGTLGVSADAPQRRVFTVPRLAAEIPWVQVDNIPVGKNTVTIRHDGNDKSSLRNVSGQTITWQAEFYGYAENLLVNGKSKPAKTRDLNGRTVAGCEVVLKAGESATVEVPRRNPGYVMLSDLAPASTTSEVFKNVSPGGKVLMLGGKAWFSGISTRSNNSITYKLAGQYSRFSAYLGIDGESGDGGSVSYRFFKDDKLILDSGVMKGSTPGKSVALDLSKADTFKIEVTDGGDGGNADSADIIDAVLSNGTATGTESATAVARMIREGIPPATDDTRLKLPEVPAGFTIAIKKSSNPQLVSLGGVITPPVNDDPVELVFKVTKTADKTIGYSKDLVVYIPSRTPTEPDQVAKRIQTIRQPSRLEKRLELPVVPKGFAVTIKSSSAPDILGLDAAIHADGSYHLVQVALEISKVSNGTKAGTGTMDVWIPSKDYVYCTDLEWRSAITGSGKIVKDRSFGGNALRLGGKTFPRGLGCHAIAKFVYDTDGRYSRFVSTVGLDSDAGEAGSVQFVVSADGEKLFSTPVFRSSANTQVIDIPIRGKKQVVLEVLDGGDGINSDHADWGDARFYYDDK